MQLDYLVVPVEEPADSRDWYRETLRLDVEWDTADFAMVTGAGGARLGLHRGEPPADPEAIQIHFEVDDIDTLHGELAETGSSSITCRPTPTGATAPGPVAVQRVIASSCSPRADPGGSALR